MPISGCSTTTGGFPVDRLRHSLQTATRAHQAGESEEYVVAALLHDIGDTLGSYNHPDVAAAILKPFVDEKLHWMVEHHGVFPHGVIISSIIWASTATCASSIAAIRRFEDTARFYQIYDQTAFDRSYDSAPLRFSSRWSAGFSRREALDLRY